MAAILGVSLSELLVRSFWRRAHRAAGGGATTWLHDRFVRTIVNERVSGSAGRWPMDWLESLALQPFGDVVSLGCGTGALERDLSRRSLARRILGLDLSPAALEVAAREAESAGCSGIDYQIANLDQLTLPTASCDAVFVHQALHHVKNLESCLDVVARALRPDGILYIDEYVGPSRHEWKRGDLDRLREVFVTLPAPARRVRRLGLPVDWKDPSEAVRSSEIEVLVAERFDLVARRPYGGNLMAPLMPNLDLDRLPEAEHEEWVRRFAAAEDRWIAEGEKSYYVTAVYRPR